MVALVGLTSVTDSHKGVTKCLFRSLIRYHLLGWGWGGGGGVVV